MNSDRTPNDTRAARSYSVDAAASNSAYKASLHPAASSNFATVPENALGVGDADKSQIESSQIPDAVLQQDLLERYGCVNDNLASFESEAKLKTSRDTGSKVTIRRIPRSSLQAAYDANREIEVMCRAQDASILLLIESLELDDVIWTVKEHRTLETMREVVSLQGPLSEHTLKTSLNQLFSGIASIFAAGFAHLRICDRSVCFDENRQIVITDLHYACEYGKDKTDDLYAPTQEKYGNDIYVAPEVFAINTYNARKATIWSCGVLIYFMTTAHTDKLSNLDHPSFEQPLDPTANNPTPRRHSTTTTTPKLPVTIIHYPTSRHTIPNYIRMILPKMLAPDPHRRAELIEIASRVPKDFTAKATRPLMELAWLDYKSHVGPHAGLYNIGEDGWGAQSSSASSIYSMVSSMSNPFASLLGSKSSRRKSAPTKGSGEDVARPGGGWV